MINRKCGMSNISQRVNYSQSSLSRVVQYICSAVRELTIQCLSRLLFHFSFSDCAASGSIIARVETFAIQVVVCASACLYIQVDCV